MQAWTGWCAILFWISISLANAFVIPYFRIVIQDCRSLKLLNHQALCSPACQITSNSRLRPFSAAKMMVDGASEKEHKVQVVAAVCERNGKVLMVERTKRSRGFWEFPGGKVEDGETNEAALLRELREELRVTGNVVVGGMVAVGHDGPVQVTSYNVQIEGDFSPSESLNLRWVDTQNELWRIAVPPADSATAKALMLRSGSGA